MRTLRITLIFAVLVLVLWLVVGSLYDAVKPITGYMNPEDAPRDPVLTLIPIACGMLVAPFTLRLNRWIERRMRDEKKKKI